MRKTPRSAGLTDMDPAETPTKCRHCCYSEFLPTQILLFCTKHNTNAVKPCADYQREPGIEG